MGCNIARRKSGQTSARSFMATEPDKSMNAGKHMSTAESFSKKQGFSTGAPAHAQAQWLLADLEHIAREVNRLQVRIAKATQAGRWGKVQALQRLLSRSHGGKMLAAKRVTENRSKSTPGSMARSGQLRQPNGSECCHCATMKCRDYTHYGDFGNLISTRRFL
jgi:phosphopantetheinyl transferase (holo-ACP synthase)